MDLGSAFRSRDELSDLVYAITVLHGPHPGPDCAQCRVPWPCPTVLLVRRGMERSGEKPADNIGRQPGDGPGTGDYRQRCMTSMAGDSGMGSPNAA